IHHSGVPDLCPHCSKLNYKTVEQKAAHKELANVQWEEYKKFISDLSHGILGNTGVWVMDFTQIECTELLTQCFIVHKRIYDPKEVKNLHHEVKQFVPTAKGTCNDVHFVAACLLKLAREGWFNHDRIIIWSDGGSKHFKQTGI